MRKALLVLVVLIVVAGVSAASFLWWLPPRVAGDLATALSERTGHHVEIGALGWSFTPALRLHGEQIQVEGLRAGDPPLIGIGSFTVDAGFRDLLATPRQIRELRIAELVVKVPPRRRSSASRSGQGEEDKAETPVESTPEESPGPPTVPREEQTPDPGGGTPIVVQHVAAERARIEIASSRSDRPPRVFEIQSLALGSVALDRPITFQANLTNPKPVGQVATTGTFGPWNKDQARDTPISGEYEFSDADLATFNGIAGTLTSTGTFDGTLGRIRARGAADIPTFQVSIGQVVPLETQFEVEVGESGGDVQLRPVQTRFLSSELVAEGEVVRGEGGRGRTVRLNVTGTEARVEDLVRFALRSETPPLTGDLNLDTTLEIPPGDRPVVERMRLAGEFSIREARFSNLDVQKTLARISEIGRGESQGEAGASVVSDLQGTFEMVDAVLGFSGITFAVPGMQVQLVGSYGLRDQTLDFGGRLHLDQSVSELAPRARAPGRVAGWLRLLDPLFQNEE
ncbi:MAG: hypothetical protein VYE68_05955, partial [Acidobacteriota bacterium]|nr:hypothetical protein [Acidobacteriota bacterium]